MSPTNVMAALLIRMSSPPRPSTVESIISMTDSRLERSVGTARPRRPVERIRSTVSSSVPGVACGASWVDRAATATSQPASASATAVAAPTPRLPPVTSATLPSRSITPVL